MIDKLDKLFENDYFDVMEVCITQCNKNFYNGITASNKDAFVFAVENAIINNEQVDAVYIKSKNDIKFNEKRIETIKKYLNGNTIFNLIDKDSNMKIVLAKDIVKDVEE